MRIIPAFCNSVLLFALIQSGFAQTATNIQQYLSLTPQQITAIKALNATYSSFLRGKQARVNVVNQELQTIYSTPPPDPAQLGPRYLELEAIRRQEADSVNTLQQQARAQLTPAQLMLIQTLNTAIELQPLASDASCAFLLDAPLPGSFDFTTAGGNYIGTLGDFYLGAVLVPTGIGFASFLPGLTTPYIPPAPSATFCGSNNFPISVREYLNLTDPQVSAIAAASASYNDSYLRDQNQVSDLQVQIRDQTAAPTLDSSALGNSYAQLASVGQQIQTQSTQLRQAARATLTDAQSTQLKMLQNAVAIRPLAYQAISCALLMQPPATQGSLPSDIVPANFAGGCPL